MTKREEVAKLANVSPATVSNVINKRKYVSHSLTERVMRAIEELDYVPNEVARGLVTNHSRQIALLVDEIVNPYYAEIAQGVEAQARTEGYMMCLMFCDNDIHQTFDNIRRRRIDGIFDMAIEEFSGEEIRYLRKQSIALSSAKNYGYGSLLTINYSEAMTEAMTFLLQMGHRRIAFITGLQPGNDVGFRETIYRECLGREGLGPDESLILHGGYPETASDRLGYLFTKKLLETRPDVTAIFAVNDLMAYGAVKAAAECGRRCPEDISVIGCDDIFLSTLFSPPLTTISIDKRELGRKVMLSLCRQIRDGKQEAVTVSGRFINRGSVAARRAGG